MKKKIILSFIISILIFAFLGCGGGSETISYKKEAKVIRDASDLEVLEIKGVIVDGYIVGASIRVEGANSDSLTSGENGEYSIDISSNSEIIKIQASGGKDKDTGDNFEGILRTTTLPTSDIVYTTPLTTLVSFLVDDGDSLDDARIKVTSNLGFSDDLILSKTDPFGDGLPNSVKVRLFKTTQQVQKVSEILKDSLDENDISYDDIAKTIAKTISENTGNKNSADILNSDALIEGVLNKVTGNKKRASDKLNSVKVALHQMVNTIESIKSIEHSKNIHFISSVYEKQAKRLNVAIHIGDQSIEDLKLNMKNLATTLADMSKVDSFMKAIRETFNSSLVDSFIKKVSDAKGVIDISNEAIQNDIIGKEPSKETYNTPSTGGGSGNPTKPKPPVVPDPCSSYTGLTPPSDDKCSNDSEPTIPSFVD